MRKHVIPLVVLLLTILFNPSPASGCQRVGAFSFDEIFSADVIVRVTAVKYVIAPGDMRTTGEPESTVEFKVEEILKGEKVQDSITLHGYLSETDDFNDIEVPYKFVRPNGRHGSCFANTYKQGAQFLLFMKKQGGELTTNISALGPTNEQLHGEDDPWLLWTRKHLKLNRRSGAAAPEVLTWLPAFIVGEIFGN